MKTTITKSLRGFTALVVMTDSPERRELQAALTGWGYKIVESDSCRRIPDLVESVQPNILLLDWTAGQTECLDSCRQLRQDNACHGLYIILMTPQSEAADRIAAYNSGVDDFLTKPFDHAELQARLRAAQRILTLNRELTEALNELRQDMMTAAAVQRDLLPKGAIAHPPLTFAWDFVPTESIAGDLFNVFPLDEDHVGLYMYDVAGHGVASAMLSASLHHSIALAPITASITKDDLPGPPFYRIAAPADTVAHLNAKYPLTRTGLYFTLFYAVIHLRSQTMSYCRAGQIPPILIRDGAFVKLSQGDVPVGLLPDATYTTHRVQLRPNDRLYLLSDGLTEAMNDNDETYKTDRAAVQLLATRSQPLGDTIQSLIQNVQEWQHQKRFDDDLSILALEVSNHA